MYSKLINNANQTNFHRNTKKVFFILIFLTVLIIFLNLSKKNFKNSFSSFIPNVNQNNSIEIFYNQSESQTENATESNFIKNISNKDANCIPIFEKDTQYHAIIDGVRYPQSVQLFLNKSINFECLNKSETIKKILFWNPFFKEKSYYYGLGVRKPFITNNCPVSNCELLTNKSRINESDFVLVHMRNGIETPPKYRPANQRWIFVLYESPYYATITSKYNGIFNLTSTYKIDSDFPGFYENYANMEWNPNKDFDENFDYHKGKSDFAVAVISNCRAHSKRLDYINQLQKYISVNILGKCGKNCPNKYKNGTSGICKEILVAEYKFYFSFENSLCKDYITEKFFQILKFNIIPVLYGGGLYSHYVIFFITNVCFKINIILTAIYLYF